MHKEKEVWLYISYNFFTAYWKSLNSSIVKEKWTLFRWRLKGRNAIWSEMSIIIELLSHRGKLVLHQALSKNLFVGFKIKKCLYNIKLIILQRKENSSRILNGIIKGRFLAKRRSNISFYQKFCSLFQVKRLWNSCWDDKGTVIALVNDSA